MSEDVKEIMAILGDQFDPSIVQYYLDQLGSKD